MRFVVLVVFCFNSLGIYAQTLLRPKLQEQLETVAGLTAKNCGAVLAHEMPKTSSDCAADAFRRRLPFYVVYYVQGVDSIVGRALAENERGEIFELMFDLGFAAEPHPRESIELNQCSSQLQLVMSRTGRLRCESGRYSFDGGFCTAIPREIPATSFSKERGTIDADLLVHKDGSVAVVGMTNRNVSLELAEVALQDVPRWHFYPASKNGHPVQVKVPVEITSDGRREQVSFPNSPNTNCAPLETVMTRP